MDHQAHLDLQDHPVYQDHPDHQVFLSHQHFHVLNNVTLFACPLVQITVALPLLRHPHHHLVQQSALWHAYQHAQQLAAHHHHLHLHHRPRVHLSALLNVLLAVLLRVVRVKEVQ